MDLILWRHAEAFEGEDDLARPLTPKGIKQAKKVARIGFLTTGSLASPDSRVMFDALRQGLRERGYVEGQNIVIEVREADSAFVRVLLSNRLSKSDCSARDTLFANHDEVTMMSL